MAEQNSDDIKGYVARPGGDAPCPAVILIHEFWGLNENIREIAREFAAKGYFALALDLYEGRTTDEAEEARAWAAEVKANPAHTLANISQAISYLQSRPEVDPARICVVGYCFGGGWAYRAALSLSNIRTAVIYYGGVDAEDDFSGLEAKILGHFGEEDRAIKPKKAAAFRDKLATLSPDHEIYLYPFAGHAFARKGGKNFNPPAAQLSWHRTLTFLEKYL